MRSIAVVGASLAGTSALDALREAGFEGTLHLIDGARSIAPDRPPLSKQVLTGAMAPEKAVLPAAGVVADLDVELHLGTPATRLDLDHTQRRVHLDDGTVLSVDGVVLATGATPRRLPTELGGVHVLRDLDHCLALRADLLASPRRVVVIGAGFIGAEVASSCRALGLEVTMVEAAPLPLQRVLPGEVGSFVAELHRGHGVDVRLGVGVEALEGGDRVERVRFADGTTVDADVVVAGIGVQPSVEWLEGSGLDLSNGVLCDETCLAAPGVVAAGDLARWPNPRDGRTGRVEQWENAIEQGRHAAFRLLAGEGTGEPYAPVPYFWSDQYDRKFQLAGRAEPTDRVEMLEGSYDEQRFVAAFERDGECVAVVGVNRPRQVMQLRRRMLDSKVPMADLRGGLG